MAKYTHVQHITYQTQHTHYLPNTTHTLPPKHNTHITYQSIILKAIVFRHSLPDMHEHGLQVYVDNFYELIQSVLAIVDCMN